VTAWALQNLGDIAVVVAGQSPEGVHYNDNGEGLSFYQGKKEFTDRVIGPPQVWTRETTKVALAGDILMSVRAPVGPVNFAADRCCIGRGLAAIRVGRSIDATYLFYFLKYIEPQLTGNAGAVFPSINKGQIEKISVPVPPLAEQKRIVAILDETFEGVAKAAANAERNLANAREVIDGTCDALIAGAARGGEAATLESLIERGWIVSHLDGNHGSDYPRKEEFVSEGVPYISANAIDDDAVDMSAAKYLSPARADTIRKGVARSGDVLFAHNATVGPVAVLSTTEPRVILGTSLTYYRCNSDFIDNHYLAHYMRSRTFRSQYEQIMRQSTRNQVPITKQREFFHLIPTLDAQREISRRLNDLDDASRNLRRVYTEKSVRISELREALLRRAFSGKLTGKEAVAA
jgi:type I restriction enzyme S subunit